MQELYRRDVHCTRLDTSRAGAAYLTVRHHIRAGASRNT
jgi:hypothetical protein